MYRNQPSAGPAHNQLTLGIEPSSYDGPNALLQVVRGAVPNVCDGITIVVLVALYGEVQQAVQQSVCSYFASSPFSAMVPISLLISYDIILMMGAPP